MHAAPPLRVGLRRDRAATVGLALMAAMTLADVVAWAGAWLSFGAIATLASAGLAALAGAGAGCALAHALQEAGALQWTGRGWQWQAVAGATDEGDVIVALDLDAWMLLRFNVMGQSRVRWIAVSRHEVGAAWPMLRSALYASGPSTTEHRDVPSPGNAA
jgi:hypothetical protein